MEEHDHKSGRECLIAMLDAISTRLTMMLMLAEAANDKESARLASLCGMVLTMLHDSILPHKLEQDFVMEFIKCLERLYSKYPEAFSPEACEMIQVFATPEIPPLFTIKKETVH